MWPNREKRHAWTIARSCGCLVVRLTTANSVLVQDCCYGGMLEALW